MTMTTDETRHLIKRFLEARAANDYELISALLTEDAEWHAPVSSNVGPFRGREEVARALTGGAASAVLDVSTIKRDVRAVIVDGDRAAVQQRASAKTVKGKDYVNEYCWLYRCRDNRVQMLEEYADSLYAAKIFGWIPE
jgi:ketosteroid isomerase-like protein